MLSVPLSVIMLKNFLGDLLKDVVKVSTLRFVNWGRVFVVALAIAIVTSGSALASKCIVFYNNSGREITDFVLEVPYNTHIKVRGGAVSNGNSYLIMVDDEIAEWSLDVRFQNGSKSSWKGLNLKLNKKITIMPGPKCVTSR